MASNKRPQSISARQISIRLNRSADAPLFAQVRDQIGGLIHRQSLAGGERLPPVRQLAQQLGVNQITIARAYQDLAQQGLTEGRRGGGTFIRSRSENARRDNATLHPVAPGTLLAERLFELSRAPGVIALTSNYPAADPAIVDEFRTCIQIVLENDFGSCFHYDPPLGRPAVRREVARHLARQGIEAHPDQILMTSGAQQGIDLTVRTLVPPGATVVVERPVYYGALNALRAVNARMLEVPLEQDGMNIERLADHLARHRVSLIYTNPTFHNPTGITTSTSKRQQIVQLARQYDVPILEDDHSSEWRYSGDAEPALVSLAQPDDQIFLVRSVGKVALPGQRLGYLVLPLKARSSVVAAKAGTDLHGAGLLQEAYAHFLARGHGMAHFDRVRQSYGARQRLLFDELVRSMPKGTQVSNPEGALSFWITLSEDADVSELYFRAVRRGVAFVPGETFFASNAVNHTMRISFGLVPEHDLLEGVARLSAVVRDLLVPRRARGTILT